MDYKLEAEKISNAVEDLAKGKLKYKEDLNRIIELAFSSGKIDKLQELAFQAKFSQGILKIIQSRDNSIDDKYFATLQSEFTISISKIKNILEELIEGSNQFLKTIYKEKFLQLTFQSMKALNDLCSDLVYLKYYFNDNK